MTTDNDYLTPATRRVAEDKAITDEVMKEWQAARAFTPAKYAQEVLYPAVDNEVRGQFRGRLTSEIEAEVKSRSDREHKAMKELTPQEIEVCHKFGQRPSQYLATKRKV